MNPTPARMTSLRDIRIITPDPSNARCWLEWTQPRVIHTANRPEEVPIVLKATEAAAAEGFFAWGFLAYEAGMAFDDQLHIKPPDSHLPLAWFALFEAAHAKPWSPPATTRSSRLRWKPGISKPHYRRHIQKIKDHIALGETYQVNYTFPLHTDRLTHIRDLFFANFAAQATPYAVLIETPEFQIASLSPELFFSQDGDAIVCEPMKGTSSRGFHPALDNLCGKQLQESEKNRAENLMVVDMVRNDLGRIAAAGSIQVDELFKVTPWPTLWQMTSRVSARTTADLTAIFAALFPSASITGAPKIKTSEIIAACETSARGIYTGAIGYVAPDRKARFSVAIRTATRITHTGITTYGVGSGIVWDSEAGDEYQECLLKSRIVSPTANRFHLIETLRWNRGVGYVMLDEHLHRLTASARYFHFDIVEDKIRRKLARLSATFSEPFQRVRIQVTQRGTVRIEHQPLLHPGHYDSPENAPVIRGGIDDRHHALDNPFLYHKTTRRRIYAEARKRHPDADEVLLVNTNGEAMEFTSGNLVIQKGDQWLTPPLASGLLPGVFRGILLEKGRIVEAHLPIAMIESADRVFFINSVRGWQQVQWLPSA